MTNATTDTIRMLDPIVASPTVARTSERPTLPPAIKPTRASEPRTKITRPNDVT